MKILFTADWHLNLRKKNVPILWAKNRYDLFFQQVHNIEKQVDLHIIGGDIFDKLPNLEELNIYFQYLSNIKCPIIIYDGNHEATKKNKTFLNLLKDTSEAIGKRDVTIVTECREFSKFSILPYADLHNKKSNFKYLPRNKILFTHVRGEISPHVKSEVDLSIFDDFDIVFAGDLHSHSNSQRNIIYPGSPMTIEFHRKEVETGYIIIEPDNIKYDTKFWSWKAFNLPQLIRKTVSHQEEMVPTKYNHTIYEIEGDLTELANIKNSDLLDKKVIKRSTEAVLILEDMTIEQELYEYLVNILELDKPEKIMKVFNDYNK